MLVADLIPDSFVFTASPAGGHAMKGFTALYFSLITLCTVGYGDIVPVSGMARAMAMMEATVGVFYIATVISRLVAVYSSRSLSDGKPS
jgi:voltage-gated potassium channel